MFKRDFTAAGGVRKEFAALLALTLEIHDIAVSALGARRCVVTYTQMSFG